jgi:hypothetical protein
MTYLRLGIEPIPVSSRLASLARLLPRARWNRIRRGVYRKAGYRCRICGKQGRLHCHEVWQYNQQTGYQWLRGFQALCRDCHNVKHVLFARDTRKRAKLLQHFITVNRLTSQQAEDYLRAARRLQRSLNQRDWIVSFGNYNWRVPSLRSVQQRPAYLGHACPPGAAEPRTKRRLPNQEPTKPRTNCRRFNQAPSG